MKHAPTFMLAIAVLAATAPATAQDPRPPRGRQRAAQVAPEPDGRVIELEEMLVEGEIERPNAFYILNRTRLGYEVLDLRTSFLPEVVDSVQGEPF